MKRQGNSKPKKKVLDRFRAVAREVFPDHSLRFYDESEVSRQRAPEGHTLAFRLVDARLKENSNVVWMTPQDLERWTADDVRRAIDRANGKLS